MGAVNLLKRGFRQLQNPLYLNANLLYGEALSLIRKPTWKRGIKTGVLSALRKHGYSLITSILTRMEMIQRLRIEEHLNPQQARQTYAKVITLHSIVEVSPIEDKVRLTDDFIDAIASTNLDFKDAIHLAIAKKLGLRVCTHDKKMRQGFSVHADKLDFY